MPMMTDERESSYAKNMPSSIIKSRRNEGDVLRHVKREGNCPGGMFRSHDSDEDD